MLCQRRAQWYYMIFIKKVEHAIKCANIIFYSKKCEAILYHKSPGILRNLRRASQNSHISDIKKTPIQDLFRLLSSHTCIILKKIFLIFNHLRPFIYLTSSVAFVALALVVLSVDHQKRFRTSPCNDKKKERKKVEKSVWKECKYLIKANHFKNN